GKKSGMSLQTVCPKVKFRPPFQRRWNPKVKPLVAPRTERNSFPCKSAGGETKQSGGLFWRGEPSPGVPRCALAHNKSRLLLGTENSLVLPKSAKIKLCGRARSPAPTV